VRHVCSAQVGCNALEVVLLWLLVVKDLSQGNTGRRETVGQNSRTGYELVVVDALAWIMKKDREASDTLSKTTATPELSEGTNPNAYCLCYGLQSGT